MQYRALNNWLSKQDSNQSMHFICIAFSRRKTRAKLRRAPSGEFAARNSMSGGRRAGCYSDQVYRGRASGFQGAEPTGLPPHSTHWCRHGLAEPEPPIEGLALRFAGLGVVRASSPAPRTNGAQTMSTLSIKSRNTKSAAPKKGSAQSKTASRRKVTSPAANAKRPTRSVESKTERGAAAKTPVKAAEPKVVRVTKQERVLTLLSQSEGASLEEMMQATDWQQHSVRGFLAGTVKRKLGFSLTSLKPNGGVRRYRIETRRVR